MTRVGVVGLGAMGGPMAGHAISAGLSVCVHNRTRDREEPFAARGATRADSPAEVAIGADLILTCVSDVPDLEQVVLGEGGIIETIQSGAVVVDCSTVSPTISRTIDRALRARGASLLDCPVSGGPEGAQRGQLTVFVGGTEPDLEKARPLLESFGKTIAYMGPVGSGQAAKAVNQIFLAGAYAGLGEALVFAERAGPAARPAGRGPPGRRRRLVGDPQPLAERHQRRLSARVPSLDAPEGHPDRARGGRIARRRPACDRAVRRARAANASMPATATTMCRPTPVFRAARSSLLASRSPGCSPPAATRAGEDRDGAPAPTVAPAPADRHRAAVDPAGTRAGERRRADRTMRWSSTGSASRPAAARARWPSAAALLRKLSTGADAADKAVADAAAASPPRLDGRPASPRCAA